MDDSLRHPDLNTLLSQALSVGSETDHFEFKEVLDFRRNGEHKIRLLKAIGAFCNTDKGGYLIIGVTNDRRVVGVSADLVATYDQTPLQKIVGEYFSPPPSVQVRHHICDGKSLVFIRIDPFQEIPSIVKKYDIQGKEKLQDGTFLVRSVAAESALLTTEVELRRLCDAIAARRAHVIASVMARDDSRRGEARRRSEVQIALRIVKIEADRMGKHAQELNVGIRNGSAEQFLPLLFRPALLESNVPQIVEYVEGNSILRGELALLRTAAAAVDEQTGRLLIVGGSMRGILPLIINVIHSAANVSREIEPLLEERP